MNIEVTKLEYVDTVITSTNTIRLYNDDRWGYLIYDDYDWVARKELSDIQQKADEYLFTPFAGFIKI